MSVPPGKDPSQLSLSLLSTSPTAQKSWGWWVKTPAKDQEGDWHPT